MGKKTGFVSEIKNSPEGVVAWPNVFEPEIKTDEKTGKKRTIYRCDLIFEASQNDLLNELRDLAEAAGNAAWGENWPQLRTRCIRETAEKNPNPQTGKAWEGYEPGKYFISCQSQFRPSVIDQSGREIIEPDKFYGGCKAIFALNAYTYEYMGHGIKFGLVSILKMGEGKPFGAGRPDPSQIFKALIKPGATPGGAVAPSGGGATPRRVL